MCAPPVLVREVTGMGERGKEAEGALSVLASVGRHISGRREKAGSKRRRKAPLSPPEG